MGGPFPVCKVILFFVHVVKNSIKRRILQRASTVAIRAFSTSSRSQSKQLGKCPDAAAYQKIMQRQKQMTLDDGNLVWQKGGLGDSIQYLTSMGLCGVGLIAVFYNIYKMSFPEKKE